MPPGSSKLLPQKHPVNEDHRFELLFTLRVLEILEEF